MAGRDRGEDSLFRDSRRDWISDRATRRDDFDRDRSPMRRSKDREVVWEKDRFGRDGRDSSRRSRSIDRRSRDRSRPGRLSPDRENRRDSSLDRDRFGRERNISRRSRDRSPIRVRPFNDDDRSFGARRSVDRSVDRFETDSRSDGRDRFGRDQSRNRDRRSPDVPSQNERNRSPKSRESPVRAFVDNWGRELRLGGGSSTSTRLSPDRARLDRRKSPERRRSPDMSRDRERVGRSRERDWKRSVDDFLGARRSRATSPSSRARSRSRGRDIPSRDSSKWRTEKEWDREIKQFERERSRNVPVNKRDDDRRSPRRQRYHDRKSVDRGSSKDRSRDYPKRSRSRAPASPSPKRKKSRDRTPVVDEKSDGEDMVISDEDNNEDSKISTDDWENSILMKYSSKNDQPQKTIVVRRMPGYISEVDIHLDITSCNLVCHDIRLVRRKDTGSSRGFAFVEFYTVEDAIAWMEMKQRVLKLGKTECCMEYSVPKEGTTQLPAVPKFLSDWTCSKCKAHNFSKRYLCYICNTSRSLEDDSLEVLASEHPTNTVVLIGLDVLTSEETVLKSIAILSNLPMRSVKIARDPLTNMSKGACYLEMNNVLDAYNLYQSLNKDIPEIDGKRPEVKYAKLETNQIASQAISILPKSATGSGKLGNTAIAAAQWSHQSSNAAQNSALAETYTLADVPRLAEYSASMYAKTRQEKIAYYTFYQNYYRTQILEGNVICLPIDNASGLASAQAALASSLVASAAISSASLTEPPDGSGTLTYPMPDTSQYQYDPSSGFYYDPYTKLYFDANSQYYYNSKLGKYLYWDPAQLTYLPTPSSAQLPEMSQANQGNTNAVIVGAPQPANKQDDKKKEKESDNDRVKVAKRIAKDMEKWAKTLNQKKETAKQNVAPASANNAQSRFGTTAGAADIGFAVLERKDHLSTLGNYYDVAPPRQVSPAPLAPPAMESEEEDESAEEKSLTDWEKLICLLCKRQLGSREALIKHQTISELHKQNLAAWYRSRGLDPDDAQMRHNQYRDRASERRQKYGLPDTPKPSRLKESYIKSREAAYEQPTVKGIGSDNLGNKLLQKMGWQQGMGLGKSNQGRTSIIEAKSRSATAGLGSRSTGVTPGPGETYKDCVKKMMAVRYAQLEDQS